MLYESEPFTEDERRRLAPYFTNLDRPVFVLINLPETVKGALFARYSRYPGTLRRLFLDEFADQLPDVPPDWSRAESRRATELYERVFLGYGDDSVAQLGGAHVACEWVSNVMTKVLQRPRLASYLEQSTRYIAYDQRTAGGSFRYWHDPAELGPQYASAMDTLFEEYSRMVGTMSSWVAERYPRANGESPGAYARAVRAKTYDICRGLLPAASLSHMGIYASGQAYEQLILHLFAHPLPEARQYGAMLLHELKQVIPSFLTRIERPDRGDAWVSHLRTRRRAESSVAAALPFPERSVDPGFSVRLLDHSGDERKLLAALVFEATGRSECDALQAIDGLDETRRGELIAQLVGERANRRYRPGRGFERLRYRFEIVSDYAAFRDLQRHRMLTVQWQRLTPDLGADVPEEIASAGLGDDYRRALDVSAAEYRRLAGEGQEHAAPYALCLAYKIRYVLDLNAREAMHLIELRSGPEGHASYRSVAQEMFREIAALHETVAVAMRHVNMGTTGRLERLEAEERAESQPRRFESDQLELEAATRR